MIDLGSIRGLHDRQHKLHAYCATCDRWAVLNLEAMVRAGQGDRRLPLAVRCRWCGAVGRVQVRPPMPARSSTGWIAPDNGAGRGAVGEVIQVDFRGRGAANQVEAEARKAFHNGLKEYGLKGSTLADLLGTQLTVLLKEWDSLQQLRVTTDQVLTPQTMHSLREQLFELSKAGHIAIMKALVAGLFLTLRELHGHGDAPTEA